MFAKWGIAISLLLASLESVTPSSSVLSVHGSGTTNPSKCYWGVMEKLQTRAKLPLKMTYRGIGSGSGQTEFLQTDSPDAVVDFASGDYAISKAKFDAFDNTTKILQFPVFLGAVSFFHNVPNAPDLKVTACLLAKIFNGEITTWDDSEITDLNPDLTLEEEGLPIQVMHRSDSSSSTRAITSYLRAGCAIVWPAEDVGSSLDWSTEDTFRGVEGSGEMTSAITSTPGAIGYLDAGHGHKAGLQEVQLENDAGTAQNSEEASKRGGIASSALGDSSYPPPTSGDWEDVSLMNKPGTYTWPIVSITYLYVRQDLTYKDDTAEQALVVAFLKALYREDYIEECQSEYKFTPVSDSLLTAAQDGIDLITVSPDAPEWTFEEGTEKIIGMGDYYLSGKRRSANEVELDNLSVEIDGLTNQLLLMQTASASILADYASLEQQLEALEVEQAKLVIDIETEGETATTAALALGSISFALWIIYYIAWLACGRGMKR